MVTGDGLTVVEVVGAAVVVIGTGAGFLTTGTGGLFLKASFFQFGLGNCVFLSLLGFAGTGAVSESISSYSSTVINGLMVVVLSFRVVVVDFTSAVSPLDSVSFLSEGLYPARASINNSNIHFWQNIPRNFIQYFDKKMKQSREQRIFKSSC